MLIGTAGHVNHGKTSLVKALTGIDTDRLPEEKRRGLSVDLGFAYSQRPDGRIIGFVDVPGHDRYLHNMISGVLPLDSILLVVAADESVSRQTIEHLEILALVGIRHLAAVISKIDRASEAAIAQTEEELRSALSRTSFANAKVFRLSALTGAGIDAFQQYLDDLSIDDRGTAGTGFRLPIDRAFTLPGIGIVVTGTVMSGTVRLGDKLLLTPGGLAVRVRSLHAQDRPAASASVGVRCALGIAGSHLEKEMISRGEALITPALHEPAERIGVHLELASGAALRAGRELQLYYGTGRTTARVGAVAANDFAPRVFAELVPAKPIAVLFGDRVLLRDEIAKTNIAGGVVVEPFLPPRTVPKETRLSILAAAALQNHEQALRAMLDTVGFVDFEKFCLARNLEPAIAQSLAARFSADLVRSRDATVLLSEKVREDVKKRLFDSLAAYHRKRPETIGPRKEEALFLVGRQFSGTLARACLDEAISEGLVVQDAACIRLPSHRPHLNAEDEHLWNAVLPLLEAAQLRPPHIGALAQSFAVPFKDMERCLIRFEQFGLLARVARNRFFLPETIDRFGAIARELVRESDGAGFTAADFNRSSGIGRNLSIQVLEHLDRIGATKRIGTHRRLGANNFPSPPPGERAG
jgi:selenocysteine-specific elongation factor